MQTFLYWASHIRWIIGMPDCLRDKNNTIPIPVSHVSVFTMNCSLQSLFYVIWPVFSPAVLNQGDSGKYISKEALITYWTYFSFWWECTMLWAFTQFCPLQHSTTPSFIQHLPPPAERYTHSLFTMNLILSCPAFLGRDTAVLHVLACTFIVSLYWF